ncbi:hypothetical protein H6G33_05535 [Calothrix sp. FACHB-1219]|uniref:hypothetical protein n=1 Tax=unclassified Calothrix TaxID=2619626 RepID=UPI001687A7E4|nr:MULTISPECIES: hypothetical protein [unclassified Calothrix]MBD2203216.1 hypothetical protein [Calothrix sp. FACHB-168]MBD2216488.1 hypothetical protein [Calothrix sp. FACHB-1219]
MSVHYKYLILFKIQTGFLFYLATVPMFTAKSAEQTVNAIANFLNLENLTISN